MARGQEEEKTQMELMTEAQMEQITKNTKQLLDEQPKVSIKLHLPQEEASKIKQAKENGKPFSVPYETVSVNGYTYQIQRGEKVEVPQTVADILEEAGLI